jgi:DNA-binding response OmpR family regulator
LTPAPRGAGGSPPGPREPARPTLLLVEEETNLRVLVRDILLQQGYGVLEARDAPEALERCRATKTPIELLITELVMADRSGSELVAEARAFHPQIKALYLSSHTDSTMITRGIPLTEMIFLPKPFSMKTLISRVREILGRSS